MQRVFNFLIALLFFIINILMNIFICKYAEEDLNSNPVELDIQKIEQLKNLINAKKDKISEARKDHLKQIIKIREDQLEKFQMIESKTKEDLFRDNDIKAKRNAKNQNTLNIDTTVARLIKIFNK